MKIVNLTASGYSLSIKLRLLTMVLKTGPDRPVRLVETFNHGFKNRTGPAGWTANRSSFRFGPVIRPDGDRTGIGSLEPVVQSVNRTNQPVLREKTGSNYFNFFFGFPNAHFQSPSFNFQNK